MKSTPMSKLIEVGQRLMLLRNPDLVPSDVYIQEIETFLEDLKVCRLDSTLATAKTLEQYKWPYHLQTNRFTTVVNEQLKVLVTNISTALEHEIAPKEMIVLKTDEVTGRLRQLPNTTVLTPIQQHLLQETIRCISTEAYRSAAVMAWNFAYDCVRQWVFDNKLTEFNNYLSSMHSAKSPLNVYEDFFASDRPISEYEFLDVLRGPKSQPNIIRDKLIDDLVHYLRQRNNYAHPNFTASSANKTNAYVEHLVDLICAPPFA